MNQTSQLFATRLLSYLQKKYIGHYSCTDCRGPQNGELLTNWLIKITYEDGVRFIQEDEVDELIVEFCKQSEPEILVQMMNIYN